MNISGSIKNLSRQVDENKVKFGISGTCELLVELFSLHFEKRNIVEKICAAMANLSTNNENQVKLSGSCKLLFQVLKTYQNDKDVVYFAFSTLRNLSCNKVACSDFPDQSNYAVIIDALRQHHGVRDIVDKASILIRNLIVLNKGNKKQFNSLGAKEVLKKCVRTEQAHRTLSSLGWSLF